MKNKFMQIFKELRIEKNLTQKQLAQKLNCSQAIVSAWEIGKNEPKATALLTIAEFFQVSADYLLGRTEEFNDFVINGENFGLTYDEQVLLSDYRAFNPQFKKVVKDTVKALKNSSD